jgi:8-oxo-dGTP pyrophosphatase MutT (NUDIX family)
MARLPLTPWTRSGTELHADCHVYRILRERWRNDTQAVEGEFYVMDVGDWAVAMAMTDSGKLVLVRQFRFGSGTFSWELPAGVVDSGEDAAEAGARELYEESDYRGDAPEVIGSVYPNPAIQRNRCHFVFVDGVSCQDDGDPGPHELFEVREVSLPDLFGWARDGTISHSIVHAGLFFLRDHLLARGYSPSDFGVR